MSIICLSNNSTEIDDDEEVEWPRGMDHYNGPHGLKHDIQYPLLYYI